MVEAHSDGDVALHALSEAIFLALGLQDLGDQFPPESQDTLNIKSMSILKKALLDMDDAGFEIGNVTIKVFLERPKLYSFKNDMRKNLALALGVDISKVGLALGTNEKLDSVGQGLAIEAYASVLLVKKKS